MDKTIRAKATLAGRLTIVRQRTMQRFVLMVLFNMVHPFADGGAFVRLSGRWERLKPERLAPIGGTRFTVQFRVQLVPNAHALLATGTQKNSEAHLWRILSINPSNVKHRTARKMRNR